MPSLSCLRYHGGKNYLATKIRELFPEHTRYCEPYFGGGSVLLAGDGVGVSEFVNDLDGNLMNFWRVLRDTPDRLLHRLWATPLSQAAFDLSNEDMGHDDAVRRATAFFIRNRQSRQGLSKDYATPTSRTRRGMNENVSAWLSSIDGLMEFHDRLQRVEIWNRPAVDFIKRLDSPSTLFYCDCPYLHETRSTVGEYRHEMSVEDHRDLLRLLSAIKGKFLLSGYDSELYEHFMRDFSWTRHEFKIDNKASSSKTKEERIECVWSNF